MLRGKEESVFSMSMVSGRFTMLQWMALYPWIHGYHWMNSVGREEEEEEEVEEKEIRKFRGWHKKEDPEKVEG